MKVRNQQPQEPRLPRPRPQRPGDEADAAKKRADELMRKYAPMEKELESRPPPPPPSFQFDYNTPYSVRERTAGRLPPGGKFRV